MIYYVSVHIYMPNLILKLNNLFADDLDIANVKKYLKKKYFRLDVIRQAYKESSLPNTIISNCRMTYLSTNHSI